VSAGAKVVLRRNVADMAKFGNLMNPVWNTLEVTYSDSDGFSADSSVQVQLWEVGKATGIASVAASFESNMFANAGGVILNQTGFFNAFDFANFGYFLQITLRRTPVGGDTRIFRALAVIS
jgi:hypothetical protein